MGGAASTQDQKRPKSQSNANIVINDQQVISLAETSSAVSERVKHLLKAPFNHNSLCTPASLDTVRASWEKIMNDKPLRYQTYKNSENPKNPDSCFVWFVKK
jgi:hypothetical protein